MPIALENVLHGYLQSGDLKVSAAESCTGGLVSHRITNVSGSSDIFPAGLLHIRMKPRPACLVFHGTH